MEIKRVSTILTTEKLKETDHPFPIKIFTIIQVIKMNFKVEYIRLLRSLSHSQDNTS
jgi:hypothetical protein